MRFLIAALAASAALALPLRAAENRHFDDAALRAVQFVDRDEGWAVGDEGVVWHTIDGGSNWERQPTGIRASLRGLHFLTPYLGWVVGREELPHGAGSAGVILFTRDGGIKWRRAALNTFPGLNQVRFLDAKNGFIVGDGTEEYPSGMFATNDGGSTWKAVPGPRSATWLAAAFKDAGTGAVAGAWNRLAALRSGALAPADVDLLGGRAVSGLYLTGDRAIAAGQGGLVLLSDNAGGRWGPADLNVPMAIRAAWDFYTIGGAGTDVWVAGRPGSAMLHSKDRGKSWEIVRTGQPLPLNGLFFLDGQHGWAVGEVGGILATSDGGKTWNVQRRGNQRAALLCVHARPGGIPLDTVAWLGVQEGYLTAAIRVNGPDPDSASFARATESLRLSAAMRQAGGAAGEMLWQFPLPQHLARASGPELTKYWDVLHADRAREELLRQMVLALRMWRPDVILVDPPDEKTAGCAADTVVAETMRLAFARAGDAATFPEQIQTLGLEAWRPGKLYAECTDRKSAQVVQDNNDVGPRLGCTARDFAGGAAGLLADAPVLLPAARYYRLLDSHMDGASRHRDLMDGTTLAPGGTARRLLPPIDASPEMLQASRARRNLEVLAESPRMASPEVLLAQIGPALASLPDDQAAETAFALANQYVRQGNWPLARETFLLMTQRYPGHALTADAYRWLIRYGSSSEARRREEMGQYVVRQQINTVGHPEAQQTFSNPWGQKLAKVEGAVKKVGYEEQAVVTDPEGTRRRLQEALENGKRLMDLGPLFTDDPSVQFSVQAARRNLGEFNAANDWYSKFAHRHAEGPWRDAAAAELWLARRLGPPPKPVTLCRHFEAAPFLDGQLDEACWQGGQPLVLKDAVGATAKEYPTQAWLGYDKKFLYLALRCQHPADRFVPPAKVRPRDADLRPFDRVSLLLDLDRDYATCFNLQVDQRGCVCEDCWNDRSWNPRWFVAVKSEPTCWRIEAAIPLAELTGDPITPGKAWACNLVRVLPGRGVQSWSLPADVQPRPEGMGLLMFSGDSDATAKTKSVGPGAGN
jgi:photosystem II stability/assembly factor-like uncharacterized protein